jgi:hypothetical protein
VGGLWSGPAITTLGRKEKRVEGKGDLLKEFLITISSRGLTNREGCVIIANIRIRHRRMRMKKTLLIAMVVSLLSISSASAQFLGQLTAAPTVNKGEALLGAYLGVYEDAFSVFGQVRYGMVKYFDLGFKMGMIDWSPGYGASNTGLTMGGDVKYWFMDQHTGDPLDVSVGAGTEYLDVSDYSLVSLGGNVVASYQITYVEGKTVSPYGRLNVRWERHSYKSARVRPLGWENGDGRESDTDVALALGAVLQLPSDLFLVGELQIDDNVGFIGGVSYSVF